MAKINENKKVKFRKNMKLYYAWDPRVNGLAVGPSAQLAMRWMQENNRQKPGPGYQLHVLKTKKYPHGFFGPGGISWRHKMDRHDNDVLDLVAEWSTKKWDKFVEQENFRRKP